MAALLLALATLPPLTACAANSYAGIPLEVGTANPEVQELARRARAGNNHAQLQLGIRFEKGRGVPVDLGRAARLYRSAAADQPIAQSYSIPQPGGRASSGILYSGAAARGLPEAAIRWCALAEAQAAGARTDCARIQPVSSALLVLSYDISFDICAAQYGFSFGQQGTYREVRQCILDRSATLDCGPELERALDNVAALAQLIEGTEYLGRGETRLRDRCSNRNRGGPEAVEERLAGNPGASPLEAMIERGRGHRRSSDQLRVVDTFWSSLCRELGRDRIELLAIEDLMCALWRRAGEST